ncbi:MULTISPECIES: cysteine/serine endopeptidase inhibitor [Streptomyces]|uniref:cysteine/serine endopeptidase inhibitor n=1 Tax=Streptomyces TaxID=1883 RepID=UPI00163C6C3B|nr:MULTISPECIES: cysteine/serine endopeptidase inhibitor [Streptomyces]MBC2878384.1 RlpA-like double-psi beta-barrel domain-containing protein [Streptomyces sp. TYQ1024]UBI40500.1 RlpA-like double-psi beta-barrel domain-containing protein [Streptomyces mobaraensis]UKW33082.1 RlpA-like double-psi beta-barrel domain-containing protein [Streptomyces sp. TYQ1024]
MREFRRVRRVRFAACALVAAATGIALGAGPASADIPIGQTMTGKMTYYNDKGYGACGTPIDASSQDLVAVPAAWWTSPNPNNDPLCRGVSVEVSYNGKTIRVPVRDKCPSCDRTHLDLSQTAFRKLAPLDRGVVNGITWKFVR